MRKLDRPLMSGRKKSSGTHVGSLVAINEETEDAVSTTKHKDFIVKVNLDKLLEPPSLKLQKRGTTIHFSGKCDCFCHTQLAQGHCVECSSKFNKALFTKWFEPTAAALG